MEIFTLHKEQCTPVLVFAYNRPKHTLEMLRALEKCHLSIKTPLYIFLDGPRNICDRSLVSDVRAICKGQSGFLSIHLRERNVNFGLSRSIIDGVSEIIKLYGRVIVLEDDVIVNEDFLVYMNEALDYYEFNPKVGSITGFRPHYPLPKNINSDAVLTRRHSSWGWATYRNIWDSVDWLIADYSCKGFNKASISKFNLAGNDMQTMLDLQVLGKIDSWSIRFDYFCSANDLYSVAPTVNLLRNIGFDESGEHCGTTNKFTNNSIGKPLRRKFIFDDLKINQEILTTEKEFFDDHILKYFMNRIRVTLLYFMRSIKLIAKGQYGSQ